MLRLYLLVRVLQGCVLLQNGSEKILVGPLFSLKKDKDWSAWRLKLTIIHIITLFTTAAAKIITRVCSKYLFHNSVIYYA